MMKHLSREELIDSLEHALPPAREAHVAECTHCSAERASLQQVLQRVASVEVPEPSPLFWEHFSARVCEQVARQPQPAPSAWPAWASLSGWTVWSWPKWAVGAATLLICVTLGWTGWRNYQRAHVASAPGVHSVRDGASLGGELGALPSDEDWNLVATMAEDVTVEDADEPAIAVRPATTERALTDLSPEQRSELARLLTAEMSRPAS